MKIEKEKDELAQFVFNTVPGLRQFFTKANILIGVKYDFSEE